MSDTISLTMTLFGAFRTYTGGQALRLSAPAGATLAQVRDLLEGELRRRFPSFADAELLAVSAFADERQILDDDTVLADGAAVAVLPPICGG